MAGYKDPEYQRNRRSILTGNPPCHWCGTNPATQADHLIELDRGGDHSLDNLVPSCASCNASRGARHVNRKVAERIQNRNRAMGTVEVRPCVTCGKMFKPDWRNEARGGGRYCSRPCANEARRKLGNRWSWFATWDCRVCGQPMASDIV